MEDENGRRLEPTLTFLGNEDEQISAKFNEFSNEYSMVVTRGVPAKRIQANGKTMLATTVFDLMLAQYGVNRNLSDEYPSDYADERCCTPAWQEKYTGVKAELVTQIARQSKKH